MPGLLDKDTEAAKVLIIGDQGAGKTGAKAALVAAGYKLRTIDTDRGFRILRSLLTDELNYPYAKYMKKHGINPAEPGRISYIPINVPIGIKTVNIRQGNKNIEYDVLAPTSGKAWADVINQLRDWRDGDQRFGHITTWEPDTILDIDTLSTLAELAKFNIQEMNGRLGALEDEHGRDTGAAQDLISRLMIMLTDPSVKCNVIVNTHITRIDMDRGAALSPEQLLRQNKPVDPRGFPTIIGRALSPVLGKRWNDVLIVRRTGNSASAERRIYTRPTDNTDAKNSVWMEESYPLTTGLAEIFARLRFTELPSDFLADLKGNAPASSTSTNPAPRGFGQP